MAGPILVSCMRLSHTCSGYNAPPVATGRYTLCAAGTRRHRLKYRSPWRQRSSPSSQTPTRWVWSCISYLILYRCAHIIYMYVHTLVHIYSPPHTHTYRGFNCMRKSQRYSRHISMSGASTSLNVGICPNRSRPWR